jgi:hypothetical protein
MERSNISYIICFINYLKGSYSETLKKTKFFYIRYARKYYIRKKADSNYEKFEIERTQIW